MYNTPQKSQKVARIRRMVSMDEHVAALATRIDSKRLHRLLLDWNGWRRGREFPARPDIDPAQIKYMLGGIVL
jgi:hypothetical protein